MVETFKYKIMGLLFSKVVANSGTTTCTMTALSGTSAVQNFIEDMY